MVGAALMLRHLHSFQCVYKRLLEQFIDASLQV